MQPETLEIKAGIQIQKPVNEVFEAVVNPEQMSNYFISQSSGRMEEGKTITWRFPEIDMDVPVRVGKVIQDEYVSYHWDNADNEMLVEITLTPKGEDTVVIVTEKSAPNNEAGINWLKGNTEGWANFLACLKAWLQHGIHLREGAFDYRFEGRQ
ncbi:SRPBCC domain-containing protein [Flavobacterium sp. MFBS3-15]|uniref:SRPBCC domain-containing protein n=1 Tax=Flavobacterium sp. MFBS3-15 TaxID=2989816 RepID=UPI0022359FE9|nr:SRPBCC domain-containing protein [Flavobacterium sp. MFBS3-15]MCW4470152.1 SRPBCC domain-containing protein [Flavobacterium sp. MFBS3-15]